MSENNCFQYQLNLLLSGKQYNELYTDRIHVLHFFF